MVHTNDPRTIREPNLRTPTRIREAEKRTFFSRLWHVFRHRRPELRRPVCVRGLCATPCPIGQIRRSGACVVVALRLERAACPARELWSGGQCLLQAHFLDDCSALLMALRQEEMRMRAAESAQRDACSAGSTPGCSEATASWHSEEALYRSLLARYQQCRQGSLAGYLRSSSTFSRSGAGVGSIE
jgi:hypothetical protein